MKVREMVSSERVSSTRKQLKAVLRRLLAVAAGLGWFFLLSVGVFGFIKAERFSDADAAFLTFDNQTGQAIRRIEVGGNYRYTQTTGALARGERSAPMRVKNDAVRFTRVFVYLEGDYAHARGIPEQLPGASVVIVLKSVRSHTIETEVSAIWPSASDQRQ